MQSWGSSLSILSVFLFFLASGAAHGLTSTLAFPWERIVSFEMGLCVCVLEQWDLIKRESKPDCLMHSSKQSPSNHPPAAACRSSQQIKTLMDIDQTPNKPKAAVQSQPVLPFSHTYLCISVCAELASIKKWLLSPDIRWTALYVWGKIRAKAEFSTVRSNKSPIIFLSHHAGFTSIWMTVVFSSRLPVADQCIKTHYGLNLNNKLKNNIGKLDELLDKKKAYFFPFRTGWQRKRRQVFKKVSIWYSQ